MKLKNENYTIEFVEYDDIFKFPIITNSYPNYEPTEIYIIGDSENFPLKLNMHSSKIRKFLNDKYFLNLP